MEVAQHDAVRRGLLIGHRRVRQLRFGQDRHPPTPRRCRSPATSTCAPRSPFDDWTPTGGTPIVSKSHATGDQRSWVLAIDSTGSPTLEVSADGATTEVATSTALPAVSDGDTTWLRATLDVDNGTGGHDIAFYESEDGQTWTQLGTTITTAGTISVFDSTAPLDIGADDGTAGLTGTITAVGVRAGIDGSPVADFQATGLDPTTPSPYTDPTGTTWSFHGTTWTVNTIGGEPAVNAAYTYNGDGLRTAKTVDTTTTNFTWDESRSLPLLVSDGDRHYLYGPGGLPIGHIEGATPTWYHHDQLGSTRLLTDPTGTVTGTYTYDAYGNQTDHTGTATTPLRYAGEYRDNETGLYYLRARHYDPLTSQFLTRDPVASATREPYAYAGSDPLNAADPTGLCRAAVGSAAKHDCENHHIVARNADRADPARQILWSHYFETNDPFNIVRLDREGHNAEIHGTFRRQYYDWVNDRLKRVADNKGKVFDEVVAIGKELQALFPCRERKKDGGDDGRAWNPGDGLIDLPEVPLPFPVPLPVPIFR